MDEFILEDLKCRHSTDGWDGENALAVSEYTFTSARRICRSIPSWSPDPVCSVGVDGEYCFEWKPCDGRVLSISVSGGGGMVYGLLVDGKVDTGVCGIMADMVTPMVGKLLKRVHAGLL